MTLKPRSCPLCHSAEACVILADRNRREGLEVAGRYLRCRQCDMIYLSPIPDLAHMGPAEFDRIYHVAETRRRPTTVTRLVQAGIRIATGLFDRTTYYHALPRGNGLGPDGLGRRILDVGCTDGAKLRSFSKRGWEIHGVDLTPAALAVARRALPQGRFYLGHVDEVGLSPGSFDAIRADAVLEHVEDPVAFLRSLKLLLRRDGLLLIYVPNGESFCMRVLGRGSVNVWVPFHINLFTPHTMRLCLAEAGLTSVRIRHNTPANWLLLSARQSLAILRGRRSFPTHLSPWAEASCLLLSPLAAALNAAGVGEELVVAARAPAAAEACQSPET